MKRVPNVHEKQKPVKMCSKMPLGPPRQYGAREARTRCPCSCQGYFLAQSVLRGGCFMDFGHPLHGYLHCPLNSRSVTVRKLQSATQERLRKKTTALFLDERGQKNSSLIFVYFQVLGRGVYCCLRSTVFFFSQPSCLF